LNALGQTDLVLFDPDPSARTALADAPGAEFVDTLEEVWSAEPRLVFVTSPSHLHAAQALEAARRGCDLFVEKPLSHDEGGVDALCREVETRGLVAMVGCNMRFHPGPARVKALLEQGAVGRVLAARIHTGSYLPDWRPGTDYRAGYSASAARGGGAILDCIHEIDLALWYFGPGAAVASATVPADSLGLDVEGVAEILIRHESGALSSVHLSIVQRDYQRECRIVGSEGTLAWSFGEPVVTLRTGGREAARRDPLPADWTVNDMYLDELRHFLECLARRAVPANSVNEARATLRLALEAKATASQTPATTASQTPD
jgi:predicted dehydrogenase